MENEWIVTDPDCNQRCRQISRFVFEFEEDRISDPLTGKTYTCTGEIDLENTDIDEIIDSCGAFGYSKDEVLRWMYRGENLALMAECIFELTTD